MGRTRVHTGYHRILVAIFTVFVGVAGFGLVGTAAAATGPNRGGVVVDLANGTVKTVPITFGGDVSGIEALQLAGFAPTVRGFGGLGGAVCALNVGGTQLGCPTDSSCLTCAAPKYWVYFRAAAGSSTFSISRAGAGATTVHDGDIEGWRWQSGNTPPPYVSISTLFPPTTTVAPTTAPTPSTARASTTTTRPNSNSTKPSTATQATPSPSTTNSNNATGAPNPTATNSSISSLPIGALTTSTNPLDATRSTPGSGSETGSGIAGRTDTTSTATGRHDTETGEPRAASPPAVVTGTGDSSLLPVVIAFIAMAALIAAIVTLRLRRNQTTT